jgi:hypothetical protein
MMLVNGMPAPDLGDVQWVKSRRSQGNSNCVQFAQLTGGKVGMRDSKNPDGPALILDGDAVTDLVNGLKSGDYDDMATLAG